MDRVAVFVDAGYLFKASARALLGHPAPRGALYLDISEFVDFASAEAIRLTGQELLRLYWYDGTSAGPTTLQSKLAYHSNVKVRLGLINSFNQQKGVDALLVTDLIKLAQNRAIASVVLISGDADMQVGVQQAQDYGVRVHLIGVGDDSRNSVSNLLQQDADQVVEWNNETLAKFLAPKRPVRTFSESVCQGLVEQFLDEDPDTRRLLERESPGTAGWRMIPKDIDAEYRGALSKEFGRLDQDRLRTARRLLWEAVDQN